MGNVEPTQYFSISVTDDEAFARSVQDWYQRAYPAVNASDVEPETLSPPNGTCFLLFEQLGYPLFAGPIIGYCTNCWKTQRVSSVDLAWWHSCPGTISVGFYEKRGLLARAETILLLLSRSCGEPFDMLWRLLTKHLECLYIDVNYVTHSDITSLCHRGLLREEVFAESTRNKIEVGEVNPPAEPYNIRLPANGVKVPMDGFILNPYDPTSTRQNLRRWYELTSRNWGHKLEGVERAYHLTSVWCNEQISDRGVFCTRCRSQPLSFPRHKCQGESVNLYFAYDPKSMPIGIHQSLRYTTALLSAFGDPVVQLLWGVLTKHVLDLMDYGILGLAAFRTLDKEGLLDLTAISPIHVSFIKAGFVGRG